MKKDKQMTQAAILLSKLQFQQGISSETQEVASFVNSVLIPLMIQPANSNDYKRARQSLIERGKSAKNWMEEKKVLPNYMKDY